MNWLKELFRKLFDWYLSREALPYWCVLLVDCLIVTFCGVLGLCAQYGLSNVLNHALSVVFLVFFYLVFYIIGFRSQHTYSGIIRYSSFTDLARIGLAMTIGSLLSFAASLVQKYFGFFAPSWYVFLFVFILGTFLILLSRIVGRLVYVSYRTANGQGIQNVFVYGTMQGGISIAKGVLDDPSPRFRVRGFISCEPGFSGNHLLLGKRVYAQDADIIRIMQRKRVKSLLVSPMQNDAFLENQEFIDMLTDAGIRIYMMQDTVLWDGESNIKQSQLSEVEIEDLLPRDKIEVDLDAIGELLTGKRILITGAAGSIGGEMVKQVAEFKPAEMILIDQAETPMHDVRLLMSRDYPKIKSETIVTSISNKTHMEKIFSEHRPEYVFHAAAYKHVPMMEDNPAMAVQNNIYGTRVIADLAVKYGTKKFVMISTDKAVNPTNVMGCSKRICEIYCQSLNAEIMKRSGSLKQVNGELAVTQFVTTRFGNVLGSNGSVIPIFKEQIKKGGPLTVTHPDIIRFFMLIPEACRLVLEAGTMGKGGEIFVFDMGKPVKIVDLARRMIRLSGAKNIEIKFTGLRDGEKLFEEVLNDAERTKPTHHPKIMIAAVREYEYATACENEERLLEASYSYDDMEIVKIMKEIVPEYKSKSSKYEVLDK